MALRLQHVSHALDGPAVCRDIHPVTFWVTYPALCYSPKGVRFCLGLGRLLYRRHILHLETEVVNPPGQLWPADQRYANETIRQVDGAVGTPILFFQTEHARVVLGEFLPVLDIERNMPDTWFFHCSSP